MKISLQRLTDKVRGPTRLRYLSPEAAVSLERLENDTGGLIYTDFWRDPISHLVAKRLKADNLLPGYCGHGFGLSLDLDVKAVLEEKKISYEVLLHIMRKRGWYCHRRDGNQNGPLFDHFNFLGELADLYLAKCTLDPMTWHRAIEERIYERYGKEFQLDVPAVQRLLGKIGMYRGELSSHFDLYTREAILAFQRAWDLTETGNVDATFCRALVFVSADTEFLPALH
jgi:hypothetical protein